MHLDQSPQSLPRLPPDVLLRPDTGCSPATSLDQSEPSISSADLFRPMATHPAPLAIWLSNVMWAIRHFMRGIPFYRHFILQNFAAPRTLLCFLSSQIECDQAAYFIQQKQFFQFIFFPWILVSFYGSLYGTSMRAVQLGLSFSFESFGHWRTSCGLSPNYPLTQRQ